MKTRGIRRRFLATLPELDRRGLVARRYGSLFVYAAKVGGARREEVLGVLSLARRLKRFPRVWPLFETGTVGRSVLLRVPVEFLEEDEGCWVDHLKNLSKSQIETLVAAERTARSGVVLPKASGAESGSGVSSPEKRSAYESGFRGPVGLPGQGRLVAQDRRQRRIVVELGKREYSRLLLAQRERASAAGRPVSLGEVLREAFLENFMDTRPVGEVAASREERARLQRRAETAAAKATGDRVPVPVVRAIRVRSRGLCERPGCEKPSDHLHHQIKARARRRKLPPRLRLLPRHHPQAVVALCGDCHGLLHQGRFVSPWAPVSTWRLRPARAAPCQDSEDREYGRILRERTG